MVAPLLTFIFSTVIIYLTKANDHGVDIVRQVKSGVNPISVRLLQFDSPYVGEVAKIGLIVAVVGLTVGVFKYYSRSFTDVRTKRMYVSN